MKKGNPSKKLVKELLTMPNKEFERLVRFAFLTSDDPRVMKLLQRNYKKESKEALKDINPGDIFKKAQAMVKAEKETQIRKKPKTFVSKKVLLTPKKVEELVKEIKEDIAENNKRKKNSFRFEGGRMIPRG